MERKVFEYISSNGLLSSDKPVLVALSGGADSVALLRVLLRLGYSCVAAHCNFRLRGEESQHDELFVRDLCLRLHVTCHIESFDTETYANEHGLSIEMAARDLRYAFFRRLMKEHNIPVVAVAHHRSDQAETVLLNLLRGSGIHGLRGMKPENNRVVRPLLNCSKQDILQYLADLGQDYVTDSSNFCSEPQRNMIRLEIMPLLKMINPQAVAAINRSAEYLLQAEKLLKTSIFAELQHYRIDENTFHRDMVKSEYGSLLLYEWLNSKGFHSALLEQVLSVAKSDATGKCIRSASHSLWIDRNQMICVENESETDMPKWTISRFPADEISLKRDSSEAWMDAAKVRFPLTQRLVVAGDRFIPLGMKGSKLVSDYMTDRKFSPLQKQRQTVLVDAENRIVWLVGQRIDDRFKCSDQTTEVIRIKID